MKRFGRARTQPRRDGSMNKLEASYATYLQLLKSAGEIADWSFQPEKLRLADRTFYEPDFRVIKPDGMIEFHETKGTSRKTDNYRAEDDAMVKIKVASEQHPYHFVLVWRRQSGSWELLYV